LTQLVGGDRQIGDKVLVATALPVLGLARRRLQAVGDQRQRKIVQQRPVVQQMRPLATQTVPGKLPAIDRQIARPAANRCRNQPPHGSGKDAERIAVGLIDHLQLRMQFVRQHGRVHQAARSDHDGRPAAGAAQHRQSEPPALLFVHFVRDARRTAQHDHRLGRFPQAQHLARFVAAFGLFEQRFVQSQVFGRGRERKIQ
jgi:hypothetical protein